MVLVQFFSNYLKLVVFEDASTDANVHPKDLLRMNKNQIGHSFKTHQI